MKKNKLKKDNRGFISVESIIPLTIFVFIFVIIIEFFNFLYPTITLQIETHTLTQKAKIQGGLTSTDVNNMKSNLERKGFDISKIQIIAKTNSRDVSNVTPLNQNGSNYIKRNSGDEITVKIIVPADTRVNGWLLGFGSKAFSKNTHVIEERIHSERW